MMLVKLSAGGAAAAQAVYSEYAVALNVESEQPWQGYVREERNAVASAQRCSRMSSAAIYLSAAVMRTAALSSSFVCSRSRRVTRSGLEHRLTHVTNIRGSFWRNRVWGRSTFCWEMSGF